MVGPRWWTKHTPYCLCMLMAKAMKSTWLCTLFGWRHFFNHLLWFVFQSSLQITKILIHRIAKGYSHKRMKYIATTSNCMDWILVKMFHQILLTYFCLYLTFSAKTVWIIPLETSDPINLHIMFFSKTNVKKESKNAIIITCYYSCLCTSMSPSEIQVSSQ